MKHNNKITLILISMFIITQLIGLYVVSSYNNPNNQLPFGMEPPQELQDESLIVPILISFIFAIAFLLILTKIKAEKFIRFWFFAVTTIALALTLNAFLFDINMSTLMLNYSIISTISLIIGLPLAYFKIYKRKLFVHNITELLIYPGLAAVFVPILNVMGIIIFLLFISLYDIWAVWRSEFMQKMAKYQINSLKIFAGFFIPYTGPKEKEKIQAIKQKYKGKSDKFLEAKFKKEKVKVNLAILGGGDVIFPIITAGVFLVAFNSIFAALIITLSATLALLGLFILAQKGKFYPAMPFLTIGMYLGMMIDWLLISAGYL